MGSSASSTPVDSSRRFTRDSSMGIAASSRRCSVSRSWVRRLRRSLSLMMMEQNFSCSSGGRSGSSSISALPRMAVSGVRSSWATSLMNAAWRRSFSTRSCCCVFMVCASALKSVASSSASYRRPSGSNGTSAPERYAAVFFASKRSGSDMKWPMIKLNVNTTRPTGTSSKNAFDGRSKARKQMRSSTAPARSESRVASSEKYVCSLFIA